MMSFLLTPSCPPHFLPLPQQTGEAQARSLKTGGESWMFVRDAWTAGGEGGKRKTSKKEQQQQKEDRTRMTTTTTTTRGRTRTSHGRVGGGGSGN